MLGLAGLWCDKGHKGDLIPRPFLKIETNMGKNDDLWAVKSFDEKVREAAKEYVKEQKFFTLAEMPKIERAFRAGAEFATRLINPMN